MQAAHVGDVFMKLYKAAIPDFASPLEIPALPSIEVVEHRFEREVPETAQRPVEKSGGIVFMKAAGEGAQNGYVTVERPEPLRDDSKSVVPVGHLPPDDIGHFAADLERGVQRQTGRKRRPRPGNRVRNNR